MTASLWRRLAAESLGTGLLVLFGAGAVVTGVKIDGGLGYTALGIVAFAFGLVIALVVYTLGTTSGAHINPAVTIGLAAVRRFPWIEVPGYIGAQLVGAFVGALLIVAMAGDVTSTSAGVGLTALAPGVSSLSGMVAEAVATFLLLLAIMALAVDRRAPAGWAGLMIGLSVSTAIMTIGGLTGGSLNPARTFGPYLVNEMFGGSTPWGDSWVYLIGPLVGATGATFAYTFLVQPQPVVAPVPGPGQAAEAPREVPTARAPGERYTTAEEERRSPRRGS